MQIVPQISILGFVWTCKILYGGFLGLCSNSVYFQFLAMSIYTGRFNKTVIIEDQKKYSETSVLCFWGDQQKNVLNTEESVKSGKWKWCNIKDDVGCFMQYLWQAI
jgi:hypothetical protein